MYICTRKSQLYNVIDIFTKKNTCEASSESFEYVKCYAELVV